MGYRKAKYIKWHNNYDDVLTIGNKYDIHGEKKEWLYLQDDRGSYQYYRKDCFEMVDGDPMCDNCLNYSDTNSHKEDSHCALCHNGSNFCKHED